MEQDLRTNAMLSAVVEHGIRLGDAQGSAIGWAYMQAYDVPRASIARVLAYPKARRSRAPSGVAPDYIQAVSPREQDFKQ